MNDGVQCMLVTFVARKAAWLKFTVVKQEGKWLDRDVTHLSSKANERKLVMSDR